MVVYLPRRRPRIAILKALLTVLLSLALAAELAAAASFL
jgi:hypothetical protein